METALEAASEEADKARQRFRIRQENTLLQEAMVCVCVVCAVCLLCCVCYV